MSSTAQRVLALKQSGEDFEWYPTTNEIIDMVKADIVNELDYHHGDVKILDVGAGDGRVLEAITAALQEDKGWHHRVQLFAIEKATPHLNAMPKAIVVIGTDFRQQMIVDKSMTVMFSNPPYSEYEDWATKLIRESSTKYLYLVIPRRWRQSLEINAAIASRNAEPESLGEFDFEDADRKARCKVEVIRIYLGHSEDSPFNKAIEDMMPELEVFDMELDTEDDVYDRACRMIESDSNLIQSLVKAYDAELLQLVDNYRGVAKLSPIILKELDVTKCSVMIGIKEKIKGLKHKYWRVLFDRLEPITKRLATKQRKQFLDSLENKSTIDFTESNIYSMLIWITKWSNDYFDEQVIGVFRTLSEKCNVVNYKSNHKVWERSGWRYLDEHHSHYKLEYRVVCERVGGISTSQWQFEQRNGLAESAFDFIRDCITVANNLGFDCDDTPQNYRWSSSKKNTIVMTDGEPLVAVRAYKNQNLHMQFSQKVMLAINVEVGRLLGWLRNAEDAVEELQVTNGDAEFVRSTFGSSFRIAPSNMLKLT